jgi:hypothetical protein
MKTTRSFLVLALFLFVSMSSRLSAQGFYWESTMSGGPMGDHVSKNYMMPKMFKVDQDGQQSIITNLDKKMVFIVNHQQKTYSEMTFDSMQARMKQAGGANEARMEELQAKMKDMPEEQRKMMEKMMGPMAGGQGSVEVRKTDSTKTIAGLSCTKFDIIQGEKTIMTVWATTGIKGFNKLRADWEEFSARMTDQMPGQMGKSIAAGMKKIEGFPMETQIGGIVNTVTKIEQRSTPASVFTVPSDYTKTVEAEDGK